MYGRKHTEATLLKLRGKKHTEATLREMSLIKLGEKNPLWRGDEVGYAALHEWVRKRKPKPAFCEVCGKQPPFDLASIDDKYTRNLDDWRWLCRKCHMKIDGRSGKLSLMSMGDKNLKRGRNGRFERKH